MGYAIIVMGYAIIVPRRSSIAHHRRSWPATPLDKAAFLLAESGRSNFGCVQ
jgi:hypothetical protein